MCVLLCICVCIIFIVIIYGLYVRQCTFVYLQHFVYVNFAVYGHRKVLFIIIIVAVCAHEKVLFIIIIPCVYGYGQVSFIIIVMQHYDKSLRVLLCWGLHRKLVSM